MHTSPDRVYRMILALAALLTTGCMPDQALSTSYGVMQQCTTVALGDEARARMTPAFVDSLGLYLPHLEVLSDRVAFAASQSNQVVITDRAFTKHAVLGRKGGGPGDMLAPMAIRPTSSGIAVAEGGNSRVSFWSNDGKFLHSVRVDAAAETFAVDEQNRVYTPSNDRDSYVLESSQSRLQKHWGKRLESSTEVTKPSYWLDMVARSSDGTLFVFDNTNRAVVVLSSTGEDQQAFRLPTSIDEAIAREIERTDKSFSDVGLRGSTAALREFRVTDDGQLFIRTIGDGPFALLVDPQDMSCASLALPTDSSARAAVKGAFAMTVADSTLFVVSAIGNVLEFALPPLQN